MKSRTKARIVKPGKLQKSSQNYETVQDEDAIFQNSKQDKRRIKHSLLLAKAQKSANKPTGITKRRRPSKKLVTNLNALADALPEVAAVAKNDQRATIKGSVKSLRTKPGMAKKKHQLDQAERLRFGQNLAIISQARDAEGESRNPSDTKAVGSEHTVPNRWASLRQHIAQSMGTPI